MGKIGGYDTTASELVHLFGLVLVTLAAGYFPQEYANYQAQQVGAGGLTSLLFALSVLLKNWDTNYFALKSGVPVNCVTLLYIWRCGTDWQGAEERHG